MRSIRSILSSTAVGSWAASLALMSPGVAQAGDYSACMSAIRANVAAKSYHTTMVVALSSGSQTSTVDIQKPDRMHERGPGNEMIAIGSKVWMKMNGEGWKLMPNMGDLGSLASMDPTKDIKTNIDGSCSDAGMGIWNGMPAHIYKGTAKNKDGTTTTSTMYQLSDGYVHHMETSGLKGGTSTFDFSNFNATTVSPP